MSMSFCWSVTEGGNGGERIWMPECRGKTTLTFTRVGTEAGGKRKACTRQHQQLCIEYINVLHVFFFCVCCVVSCVLSFLFLRFSFNLRVAMFEAVLLLFFMNMHRVIVFFLPIANDVRSRTTHFFIFISVSTTTVPHSFCTSFFFFLCCCLGVKFCLFFLYESPVSFSPLPFLLCFSLSFCVFVCVHLNYPLRHVALCVLRRGGWVGGGEWTHAGREGEGKRTSRGTHTHTHTHADADMPVGNDVTKGFGELLCVSFFFLCVIASVRRWFPQPPPILFFFVAVAVWPLLLGSPFSACACVISSCLFVALPFFSNHFNFFAALRGSPQILPECVASRAGSQQGTEGE
ncbi:hypothetical protein TCSYLVIO_005309 [Trypanosoma cruzi]|nr:hypothetical protein TCSYLVIO_005309 [Trypanosoma cruzi]